MRRTLFAALAAFFALVLIPAARAIEFQPYEASVVEKAIHAGEPVVVHVYASWCPVCRAQKTALAALVDDKKLDGVKFFRLDYDGQADIVSALHAPRSTLIVFKGGKEVARMTGGTSQEDVLKAIQAAF